MPCPGTKLPFFEVYSDQRQCYVHLDLSGTPIDQVAPCPTKFNSIIQKEGVPGLDYPALTHQAIRRIEYMEEIVVPARHATGRDGWPYNFPGREASGKVPSDQRNNYCRHLVTVPTDAPKEAKDAAQKLLHAYTRGEDYVQHWAKSCKPERPGAGFFILTPYFQFSRDMPNHRHLLPSS